MAAVPILPRTKEEVRRIFASLTKKEYQKRGKFLYRLAVPGETVLTIVSGKLETMKTASNDHHASEVVIRNIQLGSSAETYIISGEKFKERYRMVNQEFRIDGHLWNLAEARGVVSAAQYDGEAFSFMAPWGEEMVCLPGDWLATPVPGDPGDLYRIENETFEQTYG